MNLYMGGLESNLELVALLSLSSWCLVVVVIVVHVFPDHTHLLFYMDIIFGHEKDFTLCR